jgi:hypothetical protein
MEAQMLKVFIGYDPRQAVAFNVLAHSVMSRATEPIAIVRLQLNQLAIKRRGLTEFTYSRFLVPFLSNFEGKSIFLDADMLCLGNICELGWADSHSAIGVVKHERTFEQPSMMVFNNWQCRALTPTYVDNPENNLYDLAWAASVGSLTPDWNHLVGYDAPNPEANLVHFTMGIPCWPETKGCEFSEAWHKELKSANSTVSFEALMGNSVHVQNLDKLKVA